VDKAKRPLVLAIDPANAGRIRQWLTEWDLPVAVTPKVKGIVDETSCPSPKPGDSRWAI
jgi:hypothetical protein